MRWRSYRQSQLRPKNLGFANLSMETGTLDEVRIERSIKPKTYPVLFGYSLPFQGHQMSVH
jgi:hypothetical protein